MFFFKKIISERRVEDRNFFTLLVTQSKKLVLIKEKMASTLEYW